MNKILGLLLLISPIGYASGWEIVETKGEPKPRHEAGFVEVGGEFYLLGGRRIQPVCIYNPETNEWRDASKPPIEIHHFQPVAHNGLIYIICAMTGEFPNETALDKVLIYDPAKDQWKLGDEIPKNRRRGAAGVVNIGGVFYIVGGIQRGHMGGYVNWFDQYDPGTGKWTKLENAPHKRDHFHAAYLDGKIYAAGGRTTSKETKQLFDLTVPEVDVFDLETGRWDVLPENLPTPRAGNSTAAIGKDIVVAGGETAGQKPAHNEVEAWDTEKACWHDYPSLNQGRHGTALVLHEGYVYTCSGSGNRGGSPELTTTERLKLPLD